MPRYSTFSEPITLTHEIFSPRTSLPSPSPCISTDCLLRALKNFVPCCILINSTKNMGLPGLNTLFRLRNFIIHLVSLFLATFNTAKDFLDFMEYSREKFTSITSSTVFMITVCNIVTVLRTAQSITSTLIRNCRLT